MHVHSVGLRNLFNHAGTDVELPERGLVVVRGDNGSGKSSLCECVAVACWGKTLRGTQPWLTGASCVASATVDDLWMRRTKTAKGSPKLEWGAEHDEHDTVFPTTTKAQEALEARVGSFDVWRRSHVFSSSDAAHFTLATDGERKRLLEQLLGLDRFDPALVRCRADLRGVEAKAGVKEAELASANAALVAAAQRRGDAEQALAALGPKPTGQLEIETAAKLAELQQRIALVSNEIIALQDDAEDEKTQAIEMAALCRQHRKAEDSVKEGTCPTCLQLVSTEQAEAARVSFCRRWDEANAVYVQCDAAATEMRAELKGMKAELDELNRQAGELRVQQAREATTREERKRWAKTKAQLDATIADANEKERAAKKQAKQLTKERAALQERAATLRAVEKVLGLKGVRANVLGSALGGLEMVGNTWLAKLHRPDLKVSLRPYSENKSGSVSDAISLDVIGAGGGYGYRASSGGERRRVDVALVLALAEVAGASRAQEVGTLWFDEVFDCLDADGMDAVCEAVEELSRERCVVVITHSGMLAAQLNAAVRLQCTDGKVTV